MEMITIILVTDDIKYAKALTMSVTAENKNLLFNIISNEEFHTFTQINNYDLVLIDYLIVNKEANYITLVERKDDVKECKSNQKTLYRYDTVENISKQLFFIYCMKTGRKFISPIKKFSKTVLFCSADGGTGKTSIALGLAQELTRFYGKSVLYLNYEEFESTDRYFKENDSKTIENYLYYMETNKKLSGLIDNFIISDDYGIKTFSASKGRNQLKILSIEEIAKVLENLQGTEKFDYIIIDGDNSLREEDIWLISACDKICKVNKYDNDIKETKYDKYLEHLLGKQIFDKIITVINYFDRTENNESEDEMNSVYIDYDEESFFKLGNEGDKDFIKINIERDFGIGIRQLSTKLTLNLQ